MITVPDDLPERHRRALTWFVENEAQVLRWPFSLSDGTLLANIPKGIYKPAWSEYALSAKQTLKSPYADRDPTFDRNGDWSYLYYQEEQAGKEPESLTSNRAMRLCIRDGVPIGVLRQMTPKPKVTYKVLGLAKIVGKAAGYYLLEGGGQTMFRDQKVETEFVYPKEKSDLPLLESEDTRIFRLRSVVQRQGQPRFREELMELYERRCAISNCDVSDVLEAAHILPYRGKHTNDVSNGIILRADLHILFDEGLLAIDDSSLLVKLAPSISSNPHYESFHESVVHSGAHRIDRELLRAHRHYCGF